MAKNKVDISRQVYGKYTSGFIYQGKEWADEDEGSSGKPRWGAIPSPRAKDRRPWRGVFIQWLRDKGVGVF